MSRRPQSRKTPAGPGRRRGWPPTAFCLVLTTVPDEKAARAIARSLVEKRLAACASISSEVRSTYWWDGKINEDREFVLMVKTRAGLYGDVEAGIRALHPYSVPEIIALPVIKGADSYLEWLFRETEKPEKDR